MIKKKIKKWVIAASTLAALSAGGYKVIDWQDDRGFIIVDTVNVDIDSKIISASGDTIITENDTLVFKDSTKLVNFSTLNKARLGSFVLK